MNLPNTMALVMLSILCPPFFLSLCILASFFDQFLFLKSSESGHLLLSFAHIGTTCKVAAAAACSCWGCRFHSTAFSLSPNSTTPTREEAIILSLSASSSFVGGHHLWWCTWHVPPRKCKLKVAYLFQLTIMASQLPSSELEMTIRSFWMVLLEQGRS